MFILEWSLMRSIDHERCSSKEIDPPITCRSVVHYEAFSCPSGSWFPPPRHCLTQSFTMLVSAPHLRSTAEFWFARSTWAWPKKACRSICFVISWQWHFLYVLAHSWDPPGRTILSFPRRPMRDYSSLLSLSIVLKVCPLVSRQTMLLSCEF